MVDQYAVPSYKEINPAIYTIISFPFLFGVMYGDIGHGMFLFVSGLILLYKEKENDTPLLIMANKQDLPMALNERQVVTTLALR